MTAVTSVSAVSMGLGLWPRNFCMEWLWQKKKKKIASNF